MCLVVLVSLATGLIAALESNLTTGSPFHRNLIGTMNYIQASSQRYLSSNLDLKHSAVGKTWHVLLLSYVHNSFSRFDQQAKELMQPSSKSDIVYFFLFLSYIYFLSRVARERLMK